MTSCGTCAECLAPQKDVSSKAVAVQMPLLRLSTSCALTHGWEDAVARPAQRHEHEVGTYMIPQHRCFPEPFLRESDGFALLSAFR